MEDQILVMGIVIIVVGAILATALFEIAKELRNININLKNGNNTGKTNTGQ